MKLPLKTLKRIRKIKLEDVRKKNRQLVDLKRHYIKQSLKGINRAKDTQKEVHQKESSKENLPEEKT